VLEEHEILLELGAKKSLEDDLQNHQILLAKVQGTDFLLIFPIRKKPA